MKYLVGHRVGKNEQVMQIAHDNKDNWRQKAKEKKSSKSNNKRMMRAKKNSPKVDIMEAHWNNGHISKTTLRSTMAAVGS